MINKVDILNGTFSLLRISGMTVNPRPRDLQDGLQIMDDYAAEIQPELDTGYIQPDEYGGSDLNDYSGLTASLAGPFKKLMATQLAPLFGKAVTPELYKLAQDGMNSLEYQLVNIGPAQNPATLPIGSGNEYDYRSDKFYPEPNNDDGAVNYYDNEVFNLDIDWNPWLSDEVLTSVVYDEDSGIDLSNDSYIDGVSTVTVSFNAVGQFQLCATATKSDGEVQTRKFIYNSIDCKQTQLR